MAAAHAGAVIAFAQPRPSPQNRKASFGACAMGDCPVLRRAREGLAVAERGAGRSALDAPISSLVYIA
jgi:hypothetical protein